MTTVSFPCHLEMLISSVNECLLARSGPTLFSETCQTRKDQRKIQTDRIKRNAVQKQTVMSMQLMPGTCTKKKPFSYLCYAFWWHWQSLGLTFVLASFENGYFWRDNHKEWDNINIWVFSPLCLSFWVTRLSFILFSLLFLGLTTKFSSPSIYKLYLIPLRCAAHSNSDSSHILPIFVKKIQKHLGETTMNKLEQQTTGTVIVVSVRSDSVDILGQGT